MDDGAVDRTLEELGHGVLSLASDGEAYAVPVSFGYDGDRVFLYLIRFGDASRKLDVAAETERACLTAYEVESQFDWRSVVVTGTLHDVSEDEVEYAESVLDDNAWFPTIFPPPSPVTGVERMELRVEEATGRHGEARQ